MVNIVERRGGGGGASRTLGGQWIHTILTIYGSNGLVVQWLFTLGDTAFPLQGRRECHVLQATLAINIKRLKISGSFVLKWNLK